MATLVRNPQQLQRRREQQWRLHQQMPAQAVHLANCAVKYHWWQQQQQLVQNNNNYYYSSLCTWLLEEGNARRAASAMKTKQKKLPRPRANIPQTLRGQHSTTICTALPTGTEDAVPETSLAEEGGPVCSQVPKCLRCARWSTLTLPGNICIHLRIKNAGHC